MKKHIWLIVAGVGVINAVVLYVFELIGVDMTNWLWNDLLQTDQYRWRVLPVAIGLGLIMTAVIRLLHGKRVVSVESDLLAEINEAPSTISAIFAVLAIGGISLLAGGSIGPEASLMTASAGIATYAATRWKLSKTAQLVILASIGALLVAFLDSMILSIIPLLILLQQSKQHKQAVKLPAAALILLASLMSFLTLHGINALTGSEGGYGQVPTLPPALYHDYGVAVILGFVSAILAVSLNWAINRFWQLASWLDGRKLPAHDWLVGIVFSGVLGVLYLLGGQTIQFSGSVGSELLSHEVTQLGAVALVGLVVTKLLATAWSKGTGYRGGLVFPSIYIGIALGLLTGHLASGYGGPGAVAGGMAGMLTAGVGSPIMAAVFLIAVLPLRLWPVGVCAIIGTMLFSQLKKRLIKEET